MLECLNYVEIYLWIYTKNEPVNYIYFLFSAGTKYSKFQQYVYIILCMHNSNVNPVVYNVYRTEATIV